MNSSKYRFTLDMQSEISQISIPVRQWDNNRELLINLTDSGTPYIIERGCYAYFAATNHDDEDIIKSCKIVKNTTISIVLDNTITEVPGVVDCEIRLYGADGELITSPSFILVVQDRVVHNDSDVISREDLPLLNQLMQEEAGRVAAEEARVEAEEARRTQFETIVAEISETKDSAVETANLAEIALNQANTANGQANAALTTANNTLQAATTALREAEEAKETALEAAGVTVSPEVSVVAIDGGHRVTIRDKDGVKTFDVMNGERGQDGEDGKDGEGVAIETGSYVGAGDKKTLNFSFTPKVVIIQGSDASGVMVYGQQTPLAVTFATTGMVSNQTVYWGENTLRVGNGTMNKAFVTTDITYSYVALG